MAVAAIVSVVFGVELGGDGKNWTSEGRMKLEGFAAGDPVETRRGLLPMC